MKASEKIIGIPELSDANGKPIELVDYVAKEIVGVQIQIGSIGHKLGVCIDGVAVLRVTAPKIELADLRIQNET